MCVLLSGDIVSPPMHDVGSTSNGRTINDVWCLALLCLGLIVLPSTTYSSWKGAKSLMIYMDHESRFPSTVCPRRRHRRQRTWSQQIWLSNSSTLSFNGKLFCIILLPFILSGSFTLEIAFSHRRSRKNRRKNFYP